jgi:DEAD/DEAH box helicase domain-containing protein
MTHAPRLFPLIRNLASRSAEAAVGWSRIVNTPLREHLREVLSRSPGTPGALLADPVFEAAFGHRAAEETIGDLVAAGLLHKDTAAALAEDVPLDPEEGRPRNTLPSDLRPYAHQLAAWRSLAASPTRSVLVSSGTGSGKTEAFLVPILDALARQRVSSGRLVGVQALLIYPLNALIASQRDRLCDWTAPFGGDIRFCLYNGETPNDSKDADRRRHPYEVRDRAALRLAPPPILVTNATMLEYMLVRAADAPILAASQRRLRWVVLDEAHSYLGSQAAEMTMLLRRTLHAFGVTPEDVSFVATSATLGDGDGIREELASFLAGLSGGDRRRIDVILGERSIPPIPPGAFPGLADDQDAVRLRDRLARAPATLDGLSADGDRSQISEVLERAIRPDGPGGQAFLPARLHLFHRPQAGVFACVAPDCPGRAGTPLDAEAWPYGAVFERDRAACAHCGSRTLEVLVCDDCGQPVLDAALDEGRTRLERWREADRVDEFETGDEEVEEAGDEEAAGQPAKGRCVLTPERLARGAAVPRSLLIVEPTTGRIRDAAATGTIVLASSEHERCPACGNGSANRRLFRQLRLGGPFFLGTAGNVLLDAAEPRRSANGRFPYGGRQLITFTDNRQGTARFAASWQHEVERNYARSRILHRLHEGGPVSDGNIEAEIKGLEQIPPQLLAPALAKRLDDLRKARDRAGSPQPGKWADLRERLAALVQDEPELREMWREREPRLGEPRELAALHLYTEFLRRPARSNSLEALGLAALRLPGIEALGEAFLPALFRRCGATIADWRDYLHLLATFYVRANSAVQIDPLYGNWTGQRVAMRSFLPWRVQRDTEHWELRWPRLTGRGGRFSRPVLLLRDGFGLNLEDGAVREEVNEALEAAWVALQSVCVQGLPDGALRIDLNRVEIAAPSEAWLCPATNRLIDRTFRGLTPYVTHAPQPRERLACERFAMPRLPHPWLRGLGGEDKAAAMHEWLQGDPAVAALRARGLWTDIGDRLVMLSPFSRIVEHSAQQPPSRLRAFERQFKGGHINVLNCSTTMEMGVDIGGIGTVAMANVPPSPANYRQRVGRAGRRGEPLAVAFTYCPDGPVGWHAFDNPLGPLTARIAPPRVALESRTLVQRHVNAFLLATFLRRREMQALTMEAGSFFAPEAGEAPAERFVEWLRTETPADKSLSRALESLVAGTGLQGVPALTERAADAMRRIADAWTTEWRQLQQDLEHAGRDAARRAIEVQARRMGGEYLLGELVRKAYLPGHGFPTDVVPFVVASTRGAEGGEREDGPRARRYPTRTLDVALREYAPGAEVVLDGVVHRSAGITLNWKRPADAEAAAEIQSIRWFWRCGRCGAAGDAAREPAACVACGQEKLERRRTLRPAGFAADPRAPLTNAVGHVDLVPMARPFVAAATPWVALENPELGHFRRDPDGMVVTASRGPSGHGYAVCLACGRAEPEDAQPGPNAPLNRRMASHEPLRRRRDKGLKCEGIDSPFAIQRHLSFGHSRRTEVFEIQFSEPPPEDVLLTASVALREALCRRLGIERDEVASDAARVRDASGGHCGSIWLFDTAAGGAGYAGTATSDVAGLLKEALGALDCANPGCERACPACLVLRDTARFADRMDRQAARTWLTGLVGSLVLPAGARVFDDGENIMARVPLQTELSRALDDDPAAVLTLFLPGAAASWDLENWWALPMMERLAREGRETTLLADPRVLASVSFDVAQALRVLLDRSGRRLKIAAWAYAPKPSGLLAAVTRQGIVRAWAVPDDTAASVAPEAPKAVVKGVLASAPDHGPVFNPVSWADALRPTTHRLSIGADLDGDIAGFGRRFWQALRAQPGVAAALSACGGLCRITYTDRYLLSPVSLRLLYEVLAELRGSAGVPPGEKPALTVRTLSGRRDERPGSPTRVDHDWRDQTARDRVLRGVVAVAGYTATLETGERTQLPHARCLRIEGTSGRLDLVLDQGFGHWKPDSRIPFNFAGTDLNQATDLVRGGYRIAGERERTTEIFVEPH